MTQSEQKNRRRLTGLDAGSRLAIPERRHDEPAGGRENFAGFESNDLRIHSRDVYGLLLQLRRRAGVSSGLTTEANSGTRQPTRHAARWVFAFPGDSMIPDHFEQYVMAE